MAAPVHRDTASENVVNGWVCHALFCSALIVPDPGLAIFPLSLSSGYAGPPTVTTCGGPGLPDVVQPVTYQAPGIPVMYPPSPGVQPSASVSAPSAYAVGGDLAYSTRTA